MPDGLFWSSIYSLHKRASNVSIVIDAIESCLNLRLKKFKLQSLYRILADLRGGGGRRGVDKSITMCLETNPAPKGEGVLEGFGDGAGGGAEETISNLNFGRSVWYQWSLSLQQRWSSRRKSYYLETFSSFFRHPVGQYTPRSLSRHTPTTPPVQDRLYEMAHQWAQSDFTVGPGPGPAESVRSWTFYQGWRGIKKISKEKHRQLKMSKFFRHFLNVQQCGVALSVTRLGTTPIIFEKDSNKKP